MPWQPLTPGALEASASIPGIDPNLVWADATGFVDFIRCIDGKRPALPTLVPVVLELKPQAGALMRCAERALGSPDLSKHAG